MGRLIAVEGLDGAGKRTLVAAVLAELAAAGLEAQTLDFPRYGRSVTADLAAEALRGDHPGVAESVTSMALLFALDRAEAAGQLRELLSRVDVVLLDRYVASNAAYGAARKHQDAGGEFASWIGALEYDRLGLPIPDLQVLLDVPADLAASRAAARGAADSSRSLDAYERDAGLQERTGVVYRQFAQRHWRGSWWVHRSGDDPHALAKQIMEHADKRNDTIGI